MHDHANAGGFEDDDAGEAVTLYVYDLSNGMARQWGPMLGVPVQGIWHTSLVLYGMEVFYGQGIDIVSPPGTTYHGTPLQQLPVGRTRLDKDTFLAYVEGIREIWTADKYHLLEFNCNSFTQDVLSFLNGRSIPQEIIDLPRTVLSTPFGQQMRPMIDQMFRGASRGPDAGQAVRSLLPNDTPSQLSVVSNLQICTSPASLRAILSRAKGVAVMFTSATCPPCRTIKPVFEDLARTHGSATAKQRIEFALVDIAVGAGAEIARGTEFGRPVHATPTFVFFAQGRVYSHCKGANPRELEMQVAGLVGEVYPAHPHTKLYVPRLVKLTHSLAPVTYPTFPALTALSAKLESTLGQSSLAQEHVEILTKSVVKYLATLPASPASSDQPLPPNLVDKWTTATLSALDALSSDLWFPVLDLIRLALARDHQRLSVEPRFNSELLPGVLSRVTTTAVLDKADKALLMTAVKLVSNALAAPALVHHVLVSDGCPKLVVQALLFADKSVRSAGAGLVWSVIARVWSAQSRAEDGSGGEAWQGEDWQVEIASAVLEALGREEESAEVVHRLVASLGLLLFQSPHYEAINGLLQVLDVKSVLDRCAGPLQGPETKPGEKKDGQELVAEVKKLC